MRGWRLQRSSDQRKLTLSLPGLRLEVSVPPFRSVRLPSRRIMRGWVALLMAAVSLDCAKLGFVLAWAETVQLVALDVNNELRVASLLALYAGGFVGTCYFGQQAYACFFPRPAATQAALAPPPEPYELVEEPVTSSLPEDDEDEPPELKRCGVPIGPRRPSPLAARCVRIPPELSADSAQRARKHLAKAESRRRRKTARACGAAAGRSQ